MAVLYTEDQQKVIDVQNRNILVSAAAGSGKTAVLVERIIQMISRKENPIDIDRLLVLTFTNAAAAEMRERISIAIEKKLEEEPENEHLVKQATLIHNAQITTIHKFCLFVIKNNFHTISLDPKFRVADEGEMKLLSADVMQELLEEQFQEASDGFLTCVESYSGNKSEEKLEQYLLKLYQFAMSYPFPEDWIEERKKDYQITTLQELEQSMVYAFMKEQVLLLLNDGTSLLKQAIKICEEADGPYMQAQVLEQDLEVLASLRLESSFEDWYQRFQAVSFGRLSGKKDDSVNAEKRELVKSIRDQVKELVKKIQETYFFQEPSLQLEQMMLAKAGVESLLDLVLLYKQKLEEKKREKGILDFHDMEHLALQILIDSNTMKATRTARDFQEFFHEILVDEYQDSNLVQEYLLQSISKEELGTYNRFMVGDVKQSIYRFRLARPEIFMEKFNTYEKKDSLKQRIDLHKNFRSRKEVLDTVNFVFSQLMEEDLGKVSYDEAARLNLGATYPANQNLSSEFLLMETGDTQEDKKELEARMIARRMKQLMKEFQVTDKKSGELRSATYGDMVVLLRTNSGWDDIFSRIFAEEGIPAYSTSKTGYFETLEIRSLLNILRVIDNPMQDIPLFGVLHSMVGGFLDEELALVKATSNKFSFYDKLVQYLEVGESETLKHKIKKFTEMLDDFRNCAVYTPIHKLILYIYEKTGFYYIYSSLPSGIQRRANLDMLMEKAMNFESTSYYGLFHFIRYIEQIEKFEVDYGEAGILDEQADVVRLMSIHKSKGLEFPICFVAGLGKNFNEMDLRSELVLDVDFGVGTKAIDLTKRTKSNTFRRNVLAKKMQLENIGEEIRVLYVALTRPKEKLIMTGAVKELSKELLYFQQVLEQKETVLSFLIRSQAKSYLDLLLPAFIRNRCFETLLEELNAKQPHKSKLYEVESEFIVMKVLPEDLELSQQKEQIGKKVKEMLLDEKQRSFSMEHTIYQNLSKRFQERYPHERLGDLFLKTTVSELKKHAYLEVAEESVALFQEEEIIPYIPKFLKQEEKMSSTVRGSAYHKVLELLSMEDIKSVEEALQELIEGGKLTAEYAAAVSVKKIQGFLDSPLALRMKEAKKRQTLFKEQPFVLGVKANTIRETFPEEETILVQGVIDVYFEEEDGIVVADYKTDRVATKEELILRYQTQLDYYATALEQLTGKKVKEKIIYSFSLMEEIMLPHDRSSL